jgi:putative flippase GtrA
MNAVWQRILNLSLLRIPWGELNRFFQLALVSICVTLGLPVFFHEVVLLEEEPAVGLALLTAFLVNFLLARRYVFRSRTNVLPQLFRFAAANLAFRLVEYLAFLALYNWAGLFYVLAIAIVLLSSFVIKFVIYRFYVFGATGAP